MTDSDRAHAIVQAFMDEGHPYYDELLAPIEEAFRLVREDEHDRLLAQLRAAIRLDGLDLS